MATADRDSYKVTVTPGNGDGTFGQAQSFSSGRASGITVGDFNGDGWQDLAVGSYDNRDVMIYTGSSKGSFVFSSSISLSSLFQSGTGFGFATADFNHDGKLDLVATSSNNSGVVVLLGNGNGTFGTPAKLAIGGYSNAVVVGDFNQDGQPDIANPSGQAVAVALGNGDGTFGAAAYKAVGTNPFPLVGGDFNGDGLQDVATGNYGSSNISVLLRQCNTAPTIAAANSVAGQQGSAATQATLATDSDAEQTAAGLTVAVLSAPAGLTINSLANNQGTLTANITADCSATAGDNTVVLKVTDAGGLSATANLTQTGVLSGKPTATGVFSFRVTVTNQGGCTGSRQYILMVGCGTPAFSPATLPNGVKGVAYSKALSVSPAGDYTFSLLLGQLPHGYTLSGAGLISGITNQTGTFNFTVKGVAGTCQSTKAYVLTVTPTAAAALAMHADYDGDGRSDHALWDVEEGTLEVRFSGGTDAQAAQRYRWGAAGDVSLLGDYDGDGQADLAVWRTGNATWHLLLSSQEASTAARSIAQGQTKDVPVSQRRP